MQNQVSVPHQIDTGSVLEQGTVELELIHTWVRTSKEPCLDVIAILSIVDDFTESDRNARGWEVVAQSHSEGNLLSTARGARGARGASRSCRSTWS